MARSEHLLDDLAGAVLDGAPVDWSAAESTADADARPLVRHLRLVWSVAQVHCSVVSAETATWPPPPDERTALLDRWGHLRLHERIGRGAFGDVFRAWDPRLDREVALKLLPARPVAATDGETSVIREGRLLARVRHPNIVTIYGAEQIGDRIGLWMEFVRGETLEQRLKQGARFRTADIIAIGIELCRAVAAVHAAGLLHRDIKAQNVMHADDGRIVLMDFGAGRELTDESSPDVAGTPLYSAPEILAGKPATVQTDIYSLGVFLYHLATQSYPVRGATVQDLRRAHEWNERTDIRSVRPDLRPALARVIDRACDPRPERRYENSEALARDLLALQPRPAVAALWFGLACAAVVLVILLASEVRARLSGDHPSLARRLAGLVTATPSPLDNPVIAVLPFKNLGSDARGDLLVDSVTTGLIRQLGTISGLQVRSQTSSFTFRNRPRNLTDVGTRLSVNLVVEGDARISNGTLQINAALLSVADGTTLWSDTVDGQLRSEADVVGLVEELTRTIVNRLRLKLGPTQRRYDTLDIATFHTYLKARALRDARGSDAREAIPLFEEVIRKDPQYAPALAALAATYGYLAFPYPVVDGSAIPPSQALTLMEPLTRSALDIDPMLAEAHAALGHLHSMAGRWAEAEASFRRAIQLDPSLTAVHGDFVLSTLMPWNRLDEAMALLEEALDADPRSLDLRRVLALTQICAGRYDDALDNCQRVMDVDPDFPFAWVFCARARFFKGQVAEALEAYNARTPAVTAGWLGYVYGSTGRHDEAEAIAARSANLPQRQAMIYAALGDTDRAFEALERFALLNPRYVAQYLAYPELASLRSDPRFEALRRRLGFPPP